MPKGLKEQGTNLFHVKDHAEIFPQNLPKLIFNLSDYVSNMRSPSFNLEIGES